MPASRAPDDAIAKAVADSGYGADLRAAVSVAWAQPPSLAARLGLRGR